MLINIMDSSDKKRKNERKRKEDVEFIDLVLMIGCIVVYHFSVNRKY